MLEKIIAASVVETWGSYRLLRLSDIAQQANTIFIDGNAVFDSTKEAQSMLDKMLLDQATRRRVLGH
jgi:hypothetical protein